MQVLKRMAAAAFAASLVFSVPAFAQPAEEFSASFRNTDINEFIQVVSRNLEKTIISYIKYFFPEL